jgi:hypothetical protein
MDLAKKAHAWPSQSLALAKVTATALAPKHHDLDLTLTPAKFRFDFLQSPQRPSAPSRTPISCAYFSSLFM